MVVTRVKLYATLRRHAPQIPLGKPVEVDLPAGATIGDLVEHLQFAPDEVKLCFVNGVQQDADYIIQEEDEIALFPPIAGGASPELF